MYNLRLLIRPIPLSSYQYFGFKKKSYMSYSRGDQTICKKTNIFYFSDDTMKALLLGGSSTKRSYVIITDRTIFCGK